MDPGHVMTHATSCQCRRIGRAPLSKSHLEKLETISYGATPRIPSDGCTKVPSRHSGVDRRAKSAYDRSLSNSIKTYDRHLARKKEKNKSTDLIYWRPRLGTSPTRAYVQELGHTRRRSRPDPWSSRLQHFFQPTENSEHRPVDQAMLTPRSRRNKFTNNNIPINLI